MWSDTVELPRMTWWQMTQIQKEKWNENKWGVLMKCPLLVNTALHRKTRSCIQSCSNHAPQLALAPIKFGSLFAHEKLSCPFYLNQTDIPAKASVWEKKPRLRSSAEYSTFWATLSGPLSSQGQTLDSCAPKPPAITRTDKKAFILQKMKGISAMRDGNQH